MSVSKTTRLPRTPPSSRPSRLLAPFIALGIVIGCAAGRPQLMPTPNIYALGKLDPFDAVPLELQDNHVEVMYCTDRLPEGTSSDQPEYGYQRSRALGWGTCDVTIGQNV